MLWSRWAAGPETGDTAEIFVSVTQFQLHRMADMPRVILSGMALKRRWGELPGAVGAWLWLDLPAKRMGSVSLWHSEADMRHFVRWKPHMDIVQRNRHAGYILAAGWTTTAQDRRGLRAEAMHRLTTARGDKHAHS